jgi:hypothetical protein
MSYRDPKEPTKQLTIDELITELQKMKEIHGGDAPVYYHIAGHIDAWQCPLEVEAVTLRKGFCNDDMVTII